MIQLACGPILEPLLGFGLSIIICTILFIYTLRRIRRNTSFNDYFAADSTAGKAIKTSILVLALAVAFLVLAWILGFLIAGILVMIM